MPDVCALNKSKVCSKETESNDDSAVLQQDCQRGAVSSLADERSGPSAGRDNGSLFSFLHEAHLQEAREFRRKGFNSQIPEVDPELLTKLRAALDDARMHLSLRTSVDGPLDSRWLLQQITQIERLTGHLSDDSIQRWVKYEVPLKHRDDAEGEDKLGSRRQAQSLARRLESTLQTLLRVVHTLRAIDERSTPEKREALLVAELVSAFSACDEISVRQAQQNMTSEPAWASLVRARDAAWETDKAEVISAMNETTRHEAKKANKKARALRGDSASQAFFSVVATYFQSLSGDLTKALGAMSQSTTSPVMECVNGDTVVSSLSHSDSLPQRFMVGVEKKKLQVPIVLAGWEGRLHQLARVMRHGHSTDTPSRDTERLITDSVIRSILWQWQQLAIQLQYASGAIWSKVKELKHIEGLFSSDAVTYDEGSQQEGLDTPVSHSGDDELDTQVRQWVDSRIEQTKPENQQSEKLAVLNKLLDGDIGHARAVAGRFRAKADDMRSLLTKQRFAVLKMMMRHTRLDPSLRAVDDLLPDVARELTASLAALENACLAATLRDFAEAEKQAESAQLRATKVKERLSAASARLTERPLNEHSRGSRLAKHWAALAKEQSESNSPPPDTEKVWSSLKKQGLLEGVLSTGDPKGYLFATRLAGELENAHHDELRLPMSPEQYTALEKGLVEYIVKWGQNRVSRGVARIIIELSFEQGLDAVSFSVSSLFRIPFKVLKASIKVPYNVNKVNNYTMPGHDKPYKAIYGMLEKKLKQLGFNMVTAPVPGMIKLAAGEAITAGAALYNVHVRHREKTFSAVYSRVTGNEKSKKIKISPVRGMAFDSVIDSATSAAFTGAYRAWKSGGREEDIIHGPLLPVREHNDVIDETQWGWMEAVEEDAAEHESDSESVNDAQWGWMEAVEEDAAEHESDSESVNDAQWGWMEAVEEDAAENESDTEPLNDVQSDVVSLSDESDQVSGQPLVRRKRAVASAPSGHAREAAPPIYRKWHHHIPADASIQSEHFDFDSGIRYQDLSPLMKQHSYQHAIGFVLHQIENDKSLPPEIKNRAYLARMGEKMLVPVDIKECKLNNTLLLPDSDGAKTGVLICLDSETPYYRIRQGSDLPASLVSVMPYNADKEQSQIYPHLIGATTRRINNPSAIGILNYIRAGRVDFGQHFNSDNPQVMDIASISAQLANTIDADYKLQGKTITNKLLLSRGIAGAHIPADASLQANYDNGYQSLSAEMKKHTYMYAIGLTLHKIENDNNLPPEIKARANIARMGGEILVPFDIGGHKLNNTILLPDSDGSKTGILICLDAEMPYYHIRQMSELPTSLASVMPYNANEIKRRNILLGGNVTPIITPGANMILDYVRTGNGGFERYINHTNPSPIAISALSAQLVNHIEEDYKIKRAAITNKILMSRAIDGANILGEGFHLVDEIYKSDITTQGALLELVFNHRLRKLLFGIVDNNPAEIREAGIEYLRAIERPFATLSRDMQSIISSYRGETVQEANRHIHEAEYIGSWVDVTVGAVASLTPVGFAINILQSAAGLGADVLEGKELDSMAIANLVIGCIPEGKLAAKIGKFSRIGGRAVKYGLMVGNKTFDLAIVGESIKTAVKTGDPLAIYQALLASGMSIRSSYHMAKNMSLKLNITRSMEESASLEQLQKIHSNAPESMLASSMTERKFRLGSTELLGRINSGELEISSNNGVDWERGSKLHLLAYRLQNAGGKNKLPAGGGSNVPEGGEAAAFTENSHPAEHLTIVRSAHDFELNVSDENKYFLLVDTYEDGPMESGLFYANKVQKIPLDNIYTLGDAPVYSDFDIAFGTGISGVKSLRSTPGELSNLTRKDHLEIMGHGHPGSITQYDGTRLNGTQLADKLSEHGLKEIGFIRIVSCNITNKSDVFLTDLVRRLTELNIKVGYVSGTRHYVSQTDNIRGHRIDKVSGPVPVDEQFRYVKGNLIVDENLRSAEDTPSQEVLSEHPVRKVIPARKYEPHTPGYQANYSIDLTDVKNLRTRLKLNMRKNVSRIQRFNEKTNSYEKVNDYEVVPYHTTDLDVNTQLRDMLSTYESLNWIASDYTGSGSMDLRSNLKMGYELLCEISGDLREPSPSASKSHFLLIEKTAGPVTYDNILGIGKIVDLLPGNQPGEKSAIIIESVVAHPYTIITKNSDFIRYAASRGYQLSQEAMARYNIKHVGTQLIRDGLKQTMQKIDKEVQDNFRLSRPESIQFSARNPITARMAEKFGARRSDASNISNELMRVRAVGQSDIGLHEEPNIISFDGPRPTSRTRIRLKEPSSFLGPDSSISFVGDNKGGKLVIQAHGAMANVNHLSAKELAIYLKGHTAAMGIDMKRVNTIILRSCYSANGGMWSTAQILANLTGKKVKAYYGVVTSQMTHNTPAAGKIFIPNKLGHRLTNAERGHNLLHRTSEILLRIRSSLRRVPRSTNVSEMQAIIPPRLNDNYRAFLVDTLHLIEGRSNPASFSQKYGINAGKLIKLMSRIDARTGLDDEEFISSFYKLFKPGKVRSNGTVRPDSVLLEKLIENSNPSFMQFHLNRFNAVERSTNSRGEIHQGQKVLIDYSFNVKKMPDSSWVGLYRHNDLPGVDDPIVWKHLDRAGGGVDIDTSSLDKDRYRVMFFYDDSYNTLEHQVSFSIV